MIKYLFLFFLFLNFNLLANDSWVTLGENFLKELPTKIYSIQEKNKDLYLIKIDSSYIDFLPNIKNSKTGGFITHSSFEEGRSFLIKNYEEICTEVPSADYSLTKSNIVSNLINQVKEENLIKDIKILSEFYNRHYKTQTGVDSQIWIKNKWSEITKNRDDVTIEEFKHTFLQPSIILTILGTTYPEEIIVLGGHGDSTAGWFGQNNQAPGADDNASGISALTETLRVLIVNNYRPSRTIKFISYAGEEAGLLGSQDISRSYQNLKLNVIGVLQLDMTNYKGSLKEIYLISDYTNKKQNEFLGFLIDNYVKVSWGYTACGYGCSDHASWTSKNFVASFPFESAYDSTNPKIHTAKDLLDVTEGRALHTVPFVKLAIAYALEMGK